MTDNKTITGLVLLNIGVFIAIAAFLPHASSYGYSNSLEKIINARQSWDIAFMGALGSTLVSTGLVVLLARRNASNPK